MGISNPREIAFSAIEGFRTSAIARRTQVRFDSNLLAARLLLTQGVIRHVKGFPELFHCVNKWSIHALMSSGALKR